MRLSHLFTKTRKEAPKDEVAKNAELLVRAGFVDKLSAGIYTYLPLGLRVLKNIEAIIRKEMDALGAQEIFMPSLHPKENWMKTGRWESMDDLYTVTDSSGREFALAPTHEEVVVPLAQQFVASYKDLPLGIYQFQNKFRMELRSKSGLLRGREFMMKDLYSFHVDENDLSRYYIKAKEAYKRIFDAVGIGEKTYLTFASGGSFSKYSHEFQTETEAGEDTIFLCSSCKIGVNKEIIEIQKVCPECGKDDFEKKQSIEVGNIFELKTKFSEAFGLSYKDAEGVSKLVLMGCYGIGLGRLMGTVVEVLSDEKGIVWPHAIAPFQFHLIEIPSNDASVHEKAEALYADLGSRGFEMLYDDRDVSAGVKFTDADLMGIPYSIVVSEKLLKKNALAEIKERKSGAVKAIPQESSLDAWAYPFAM